MGTTPVLYTSGTTSFPKGAVISHRNAVPHGWYAGEALRVTEADIITHCKGQIASYKVPRQVRIVADVPRTPGPHGDKVQEAKLRELFLAGGSTGLDPARSAG